MFILYTKFVFYAWKWINLLNFHIHTWGSLGCKWVMQPVRQSILLLISVCSPGLEPFITAQNLKKKVWTDRLWWILKFLSRICKENRLQEELTRFCHRSTFTLKLCLGFLEQNSSMRLFILHPLIESITQRSNCFSYICRKPFSVQNFNN